MPIAGDGYCDPKDELIRSMYGILAELYFRKRPPSESMMVMLTDKIEAIGIRDYNGQESTERR